MMQLNEFAEEVLAGVREKADGDLVHGLLPFIRIMVPHS